MCGIAGIFDPALRFDADSTRAALDRMTDAMIRRGPDDRGTWIDPVAGVALGHRRLAILDLSPLGRQPMASATGRFTIVFNGEVYNFRDLRRTLESEGHTFRGGSDTEVMLAGFEQWGVAAACERFAGMFAFAVFDARDRVLHLVRDRLGIKPLYVATCDGVTLFGSELKALRQHPAHRADIDPDALALLLRHNYIPAPHSIHKGTVKLEPGCRLELRADGSRHHHRWWSAERTAEAGVAKPFRGSPDEAADALADLLRTCVREHMESDVPLGAFLSGGIDSSLVAALMQSLSSRPIRTFTIGFEQSGFDEAPFARRVAAHLGTQHTELTVTADRAMEVIPRLPEIYDEPFADSSQIPTVAVSELTRKHVTVSLSGDGGDELFAGYTRYGFARKLWNRLRRVPPMVQALLPSMVRLADRFDGALRPLRRLLPARLGDRRPADTLEKASELLNLPDERAFYRHLCSHWKSPASVVRGSREPAVAGPRTPGLRDPVRRMMLHDVLGYLPDDILVKVDRAGMCTGLESRVPLLDHRLFEFAAALPMSLLVRGGTTKWLLRQVLHRHVTRELVERPKAGFTVPLAPWLRGPLRDWAESLLSPAALASSGLLEAAPIRRKWTEHVEGTRDWAYHLWDVLMFQAWLSRRP